jgi:hypothetical protein
MPWPKSGLLLETFGIRLAIDQARTAQGWTHSQLVIYAHYLHADVMRRKVGEISLGRTAQYKNDLTAIIRQ